MKNKFWYALEGIMLLIWIVTLVIFLSQVYTDGTKCLSNPLKWGTQVMSKNNNATLSCQCSFDNQPQYIIFVDPTHYLLNYSGMQGDYVGYHIPALGVDLNLKK